MQKYYLIKYPESKNFINTPDCLQYKGMTYLVPCEIYNSYANSRID